MDEPLLKRRNRNTAHMEPLPAATDEMIPGPGTETEQTAEATPAVAPVSAPEDAAGKKKIRKAKQSAAAMRSAGRFVMHATVILTIIWVLFEFVVGVQIVPNNDMTPRMDAGDLLLYYRMEEEIRPKDVVVIEKNGITYVGRIVACGGDRVEITDTQTLQVNGSTMIESNIFTATPRYEGYTEYPLTVPDGSFFVLCDKRQGGEDSRYYGPVTRDEIQGVVITVMRRSNM